MQRVPLGCLFGPPSEKSPADGLRGTGLRVALSHWLQMQGSVAVGPWIGGSAKSVALTVVDKPDKNGSSRAALKVCPSGSR